MATCDQLDDNLCGWLDADAAEEFAAHLANCKTCQAAVELQQRIDRNLAAYRESIVVPDSLRNPVSRGNRVSVRAAIAVLTAAAVLLGLGLGLFVMGLSTDEPPDVAAPIAVDPPDTQPLVSVEPDQPLDHPDAPESVPVALQPGPGSIAVQVPSGSSRVSLFRVYNVISP